MNGIGPCSVVTQVTWTAPCGPGRPAHLGNDRCRRCPGATALQGNYGRARPPPQQRPGEIALAPAGIAPGTPGYDQFTHKHRRDNFGRSVCPDTQLEAANAACESDSRPGGDKTRDYFSRSQSRHPPQTIMMAPKAHRGGCLQFGPIHHQCRWELEGPLLSTSQPAGCGGSLPPVCWAGAGNHSRASGGQAAHRGHRSWAISGGSSPPIRGPGSSSSSTWSQQGTPWKRFL